MLSRYSSVSDQEFDVITYETKREKVYQRTIATENFSNIEIEKTMSNFAAGKWDGYQNFEPELHQLVSAAYRKGYLLGVKDRLEAKLAYWREAPRLYCDSNQRGMNRQ